MIKIKDIYTYISISEIIIFNIVFIDILKSCKSFIDHIILDTFIIILYIFIICNLAIFINSNIIRKKSENLHYELNKLNKKYNNEYKRILESEETQSNKNKIPNIVNRNKILGKNKKTVKNTEKNINTNTINYNQVTENKDSNQNINLVNPNNIFRNDKIIKINSSFNSVTDIYHNRVDNNESTNKNSKTRVVHI